MNPMPCCRLEISVLLVEQARKYDAARPGG